jgi:hypothetical protein
MIPGSALITGVAGPACITGAYYGTCGIIAISVIITGIGSTTFIFETDIPNRMITGKTL